VRAAIEFIGVILLPTIIFYVALRSARLAAWCTQRWRSRPAGQPLPEPVERLQADLSRLRAELEAMETRTDLTAKGVRLRALRAAYLDALGTACRRLGVSPPAGGDPRHPGRVRQSEIYRVESALRQRGLDVREGARR
jgi:HAMP domain-containing protein